MEKKLITVFIFIFFLNLWFLAIFGHGCDLAFLMSWGARLRSQSSRVFYAHNPDVNYPPGSLLILWLVDWLWFLIAPLKLYFPKELIFKFVPALADFFTGLFVFGILKKEVPKRALFALPLYWFNVAVFYNSFLWGQFESVVACFLALSFFALWRKKPVLAGLATGFGCVIKPPAILYAPLFILWAWFSFSRQKFVIFLTALVFFFLVPFLPFWGGSLKGLPFFVFDRLVYMFRQQPWVSSGAPNIWGLTSYLHASNNQELAWLGLNLYTWGILFFSLVAFPLFGLFAWSLVKKRSKILLKGFVFSLLSLGIYLFPTQVHERYLFSLFPFLLLVSLLDFSFLPFYALYSLTFGIAVGFGLYWPQRGGGFWLGKGIVILSWTNILIFIAFLLVGLKRVVIPELYNKQE